MKVLLLCWILCLSVASTLGDLSCDCGRRNTGRIIGGQVVRKNEYPWMVSLNEGCGGSLLTHWHVLTAAHCTYGLSASDLKVSVGTHYQIGINWHKKTYKIAKIIQHKGYRDDDKSVADDISILVTANKIEFNSYVSPVCLPNRKINLVGEYIKVIGWGLTKNNPILGNANRLREVDLQVIPPTSCRQSWYLLKQNTQLCTYAHKKDSCSGDSGGPLVYLDPDSNRYTQVALVSYGDTECASAKPAVNTDVYAYIDWINAAITSTHPEEKACVKV
ncbi:chymotrypsin-1 [Halyomorpha halys]|uniref:chymotrypsin-1 n=1 Tax=Halyomorpha halys TaxID=286706 RepID=UPI0006D51724|nr:chymotrypsin-1-like [Halyomorpha halys]